MIDPNMDSLINYLMKLRGEGGPNPAMPPQGPQINPAVAQIMQMVQGQQQNPMMAGLAQLEGTAVDPTAQQTNLPQGVITNENLPKFNQPQQQPSKVGDPSFDWRNASDGSVLWKPKGGSKDWIRYR